MIELERNDVHRWVFAHDAAPDVEALVRKWLIQRLDGFYCDLQVMHKDLPLDCVCDLGYGVAPQTVIDEDAPIPDYHVLWPGKPTTNTVWTAVEDYTWFEAFSEEGCATGIACTPAPHVRSKRKTEDGRRKER